MRINNRPIVVVSGCLGFNACRYNGQIIEDKFIKRLSSCVEYITVCPEVEIGLGIPRDPVRLVKENNITILYQTATEREYTDKMEQFSINFLNSVNAADGFILKGRSPSCGIKDVKVYLGKKKASGTVKGEGIFASQVIKKYTNAAIEDEGRLTNFRIREHFLTKLFTMFKIRKVKESASISELVKFHGDNKYLLMAYSPKEQKILGRITANHEKKEFNQLIDEYLEHLGEAFSRPPRYTNYINALMHIFGYFSENLSTKEKVFVLDTLDKYREEKVPLSVPVNLLESYVIKYENPYLLKQTIWKPYPEELLDISSTGKDGN